MKTAMEILSDEVTEQVKDELDARKWQLCLDLADALERFYNGVQPEGDVHEISPRFNIHHERDARLVNNLMMKSIHTPVPDEVIEHFTVNLVRKLMAARS